MAENDNVMGMPGHCYDVDGSMFHEMGSCIHHDGWPCCKLDLAAERARLERLAPLFEEAQAALRALSVSLNDLQQSMAAYRSSFQALLIISPSFEAARCPSCGHDFEDADALTDHIDGPGGCPKQEVSE